MNKFLAFSLNGLIGVAIASGVAHLFDMGAGGVVAISTVIWWLAGIRAIEKAEKQASQASGDAITQ